MGINQAERQHYNSPVGHCSPCSQVNSVLLLQGEPGKAGEKGLVGRQGLRVSPSLSILFTPATTAVNTLTINDGNHSVRLILCSS